MKKAVTVQAWFIDELGDLPEEEWRTRSYAAGLLAGSWTFDDDGVLWFEVMCWQRQRQTSMAFCLENDASPLWLSTIAREWHQI